MGGLGELLGRFLPGAANVSWRVHRMPRTQAFSEGCQVWGGLPSPVFSSNNSFPGTNAAAFGGYNLVSHALILQNPLCTRLTMSFIFCVLRL